MGYVSQNISCVVALLMVINKVKDGVKDGVTECVTTPIGFPIFRWQWYLNWASVQRLPRSSAEVTTQTM